MEFFNKLQEKGELSELEAAVFFRLPTNCKLPSCTVEDLNLGINRDKDKISKILEELERLELVETIPVKGWKITEKGKIVRKVKMENNKKLKDLDSDVFLKELI